MNTRDIITGAESAVELAVPGLRGARLAIYAIGGLIVAAALGFAFWWVFVHPGQQRRAVEQAKFNGKLATSTADITAAAIPQINDATTRKVVVDVQVQKGQIDVRAASDANIVVSASADASRHNICLYDLYAADPACIALHEDPAHLGAAGRHVGRASQPD